MIASRELVLGGQNNSGIVMQKILAIQQEILMINKYGREHVGSDHELRQVNPYPHQMPNTAVSDKPEAKNGEKSGKKRIEMLKEIERLVDIAGKNAAVLVPKTWAGKRVRIILLDD